MLRGRFGDLLAHRDFTLNEAIALTRVLVGVEKTINPSAVAGEIRMVKVLPNGSASKAGNDRDLPKAGQTLLQWN